VIIDISYAIALLAITLRIKNASKSDFMSLISIYTLRLHYSINVTFQAPLEILQFPY
jgi:hypothetical protein